MSGLNAKQVCFVTAVAFFQLTNVVGSVYLKAVLSSSSKPIHPLVFALIREACTGVILLAVAYVVASVPLPKRADAFAIAGLGVCLFLNQALYVLGLELAGVTIATCLQPSIPVFTVALAMLLRQEHTSPRRLCGAFLAAAGAILMVYGASVRRAKHSQSPSEEDATARFLGALCLVGNCLAMAAYFIIARRVSAIYTGISLTAWAYVAAACWMALLTSVAVPSDRMQILPEFYAPLAYWILIVSCTGYTVVTAATKVLPASIVSAFVCVQPIGGTLLAVFVLDEALTFWDGAATLILAGLALVLLDATSSASLARGYAPLSATSRSADGEASDFSVSLHPETSDASSGSMKRKHRVSTPGTQGAEVRSGLSLASHHASETSLIGKSSEELADTADETTELCTSRHGLRVSTLADVPILGSRPTPAELRAPVRR